jgi:molybdopterin-guanine dinucleotide biosynthesis protein A
MDTTANNTGAIILAGGQSVRMGQDKAMLQCGKTTILEHILSLVVPRVEHTVIVRAESQHFLADFDIDSVTWTRDTVHDQGPLQGIVDSLLYLPDDLQQVLVLSCDLPYLDTSAIKILLSPLSKGIEAACIESGGRLNPLIGFYQRPILEKAHQLLKEKKRRAMELLEGVSIEVRKAPETHPYLFNGVNDKEDYLKFCHSKNNPAYREFGN